MGAQGECQLLAGPAAWGAQLLLACLALGSLAYKRHVERPQRPLKVWGLDVSKQGVSMHAAHICGMLIALIAHGAATSASSECAWYMVAFTFDTTLGLLFTIGLHKAALRGARWYSERQALRSGATMQPTGPEGTAAPQGSGWADVLQACGNYGEPPSYRRWGIQLGEWVACVVLARVLCGTLVLLLSPLLIHVAQGLDSLFVGHPTLMLYTVMIVCPLCMNVAQALIQDFVLRWRKGRRAGEAGADIDGPPSWPERVASLTKSFGGGRVGAAKRVAPLAKLGGARPSECGASLLGAAEQRSDAV